jgi:sterol desaturase/sphingolipid hydroxylase (fatty acid hydroxylase superfamily)
LYKTPTAFAAQAITAWEGIYFAGTSLFATLLCPVSVATQYALGLFMLFWSIVAHDSEGRLDGGFHYEHHNHPNCNYGFLGFADVLCGTAYWGERWDGRGQGVHPAYQAGYLGRLHRALGGQVKRA